MLEDAAAVSDCEAAADEKLAVLSWVWVVVTAENMLPLVTEAEASEALLVELTDNVLLDPGVWFANVEDGAPPGEGVELAADSKNHEKLP
jgi:hypothetical protein